MTERLTSSAPIEALANAPQAYDVTTALRIAEAEAKSSGRRLLISATPESRPVPHPVQAVATSDDTITLNSSVMGVLGPLSPLPPAYGELASRARRRRSGGLAAFVDIFTDRLTHLFAAATEKYDLARQLQWSEPGNSPFVIALRALVGLNTRDMDHRTPLPEDETLRFAGLLAQRTRNAAGLEAVAAAELGLPVRLEQFHLRWRPLPEAEQTRVGGLTRLDQTTGAGSRVPDRSGQVRLVVGPVRYPDFLSLEEGQPRLDRLRRLMRFYVGPVLDFDIQIILDKRDVPETQMGGDGPLPRLGWNAWARIAPAARDSDDAIVGSAPTTRSPRKQVPV
ncbi:type VI secretion system baseplate subunit TssG [Marivita sp. S0852]|uniref:type VI secretion system baseplate subunit TssG n=1 Tax=Marivita sp. S0852 TaxID=3373893 RepID=UPI003981F49F